MPKEILFRTCAKLFVWYKKILRKLEFEVYQFSFTKGAKTREFLLHKLSLMNFWHIHPLPFVHIFHTFCLFYFPISLNQRQKKIMNIKSRAKDIKKKISCTTHSTSRWWGWLLFFTTSDVLWMGDHLQLLLLLTAANHAFIQSDSRGHG